MSGSLQFIWKDGVMVPATSYQATRCAERFEDGKRYLLVEHEDRSHKSHSHFFASLREAFNQLPHDIADDFTSFDHFRSVGLISNGFYHQREFACASREEARRLAAFLRPMAPLSIVAVHEAVVVERTAKSMSYRAMPKGEFQKAKQALIEWAWNLVGVTPEEGAKHAGRAA